MSFDWLDFRVPPLVARRLQSPRPMDLGRDIEAFSANFSGLLGQHLKIARLELIEDLRRFTGRAVFVLAMVPFAVGAFVLLTASAVGFLSRWWSPETALAALGLAYGVITGAIAVFTKRPPGPAPLSESRRELAGSVEALTSAVKGSR